MTKFALITGASKGLGAHLVRRFWLSGYSLVVVARKIRDIQLILKDLPNRSSQKVIPLTCNLCESSEITSLIKDIQRVIPDLKVLVNNAAIQGPIGPFTDISLQDWYQTLQVNLFAPVALSQGLIPLLKKSGGASIINLSGGGAASPRANFSAYATAKAGLVRFSETIAEELRDQDIRVNCIAPGAMKTGMLEEVLRSGGAAGIHETSMAIKVLDGGGASMDRVADLALFLASDSSKRITGKLISAIWDNWEQWHQDLEYLSQSDVYTLRRIIGRDRDFHWGDK
ncbi:SDR family NAD(P)-dependent oxidoreductase [Polynucleobacter sp. HIN5]|uniref:SDR family NAD(P)-dependent oxidoreductase n=1 Tax=Polynucleobacter sp. HIN5 TaxID=3047864 RepID=UPI0025728C3B|nr:SDR family oxidoreductase [Polynucleobacter sp. HIN5]BEI32952.1 SDR family NAD(P)-dependent oxidoreductase [Polynucleobacter sp. HIN5]